MRSSSAISLPHRPLHAARFEAHLAPMGVLDRQRHPRRQRAEAPARRESHVRLFRGRAVRRPVTRRRIGPGDF